MKKGCTTLVVHRKLYHEIYILKGICWYSLSGYDYAIRSILLELLAMLELQHDNIVHQRVVKNRKRKKQ